MWVCYLDTRLPSPVEYGMEMNQSLTPVITVVCAEIQDYCCKSKYIQKDWMSSFFIYFYFL